MAPPCDRRGFREASGRRAFSQPARWVRALPSALSAPGGRQVRGREPAPTLSGPASGAGRSQAERAGALPPPRVATRSIPAGGSAHGAHPPPRRPSRGQPRNPGSRPDGQGPPCRWLLPRLGPGGSPPRTPRTPRPRALRGGRGTATVGEPRGHRARSERAPDAAFLPQEAPETPVAPTAANGRRHTHPLRGAGRGGRGRGRGVGTRGQLPTEPGCGAGRAVTCASGVLRVEVPPDAAAELVAPH